jgi:cutinase
MPNPRPRPRALLAVSTVAASALLAGVVGPVAGAAAPSARDTVDAVTCSDVHVLGARGSGQPQGGSATDGGTGLGTQVHGVSQRLARQLPGLVVSTQAVVYPAQGVELLVTNPDAYFTSLELGSQSVQTALRGRAAACPQERIVLAGYSQGAMAVHRAIQDLDRTGDPVARQILARTDGVVLISDGDRRRRDRATDYGTAGRSQGVGYALRPESGARGTKLPRGMKARIHSVCLDLDVVCDYQPDVHTGPGLLAGAAIHSDGYTESRPVNRATDAVAARVRQNT